MALEGNLEEFNIVAVLQTIASGQMTGNLAVWDAVNKATVIFARGQIIHAESTLEADRIGEILVRTRRITRPQLEKATTSQLRQQSGKRLGQILREMSLVADEDLAMAVQVQILEIMSRLLLWSRGRWHFEFAAPDPAGYLPNGAMTVDEIVSGQIVLLDNLEPIYNKNEILDEIYTIVPGRNKESERIILESDEWTVLSAMDGRSTVREIAHQVGLDADQICQIIADLLAVRLLAKRLVPAAVEHPTVANFPEAAPRAPALAAGPPSPPPALGRSGTVVVNASDLERINQVLAILLARTEGKEVCLIDSSGSLIARRGPDVHATYPTLFALAASIFASWQELGRSLGESKASTLLYQGAGLNVCLSPVGSQAILMILYQQASNSGLVNFWSREASARVARLLETSGAAPSLARGRPAAAGPAPGGQNGSTPAPTLDSEFNAELARQMEDLFRG